MAFQFLISYNNSIIKVEGSIKDKKCPIMENFKPKQNKNVKFD